MKLTKAKLYKGLKQREDDLITAIEKFRDYCDLTEEPAISGLGAEFSDLLLDTLYENDTVSINDIRDYIENDFDPED